MRARLRTVVATALAALTVVALTACAAIPTGGGVRTGQSIKDESISGVDYRPDSPVPGADQTAILRGFVAAGTGAQDDYEIARAFLAKGFASQWDPRRSVTVLQGSGTVDRVAERELTYTLTASATVDADGEYTQAVRPTTSTLTFQFVREDGEWRIASAPDGIILTPVSFRSVFQQHALYFFDPTNTFLVPDERWFLARSSTSTRIASALLAGPSDWLRGAVVTAFPEGTQLSLNAVTIENGTAVVDLSTDALRSSNDDKQRMREQLARSLASVASVSSVSITFEGATYSASRPDGTPAKVNPDVDPRPLVDRKDQVGHATTNGKVATLGGDTSATIAALDPTSFSLSASGSVAVVGNASGVVVVRGRDATRVDATDDLVPPTIDDLGFVWVGREGDTSRVTAYGLGGDPHQVATKLPRGSLVAFQVSRDSTRALALIETADGPALYVMAIVRGDDRTPTTLGPAVRVQAASGRAVGAAWVNDSDVVSVGQTDSGTEVVRSTVGGQSTTLPEPDGSARSVTGGSGGSILLRMSDGSVLQSTGGRWDTTGVTADVLGTQR
ncbi:LpqB family beta-propeller domain-containing protein [Curtobacterium caseinilyticum]|uniref:LpqB family beta-propeller domain-containing protein n=1 Tax=Curtobacterium caseinilyticum TaxID=3055137 RepID=A0ABT7TT36_9MICO|nr:LpqB family beta-propeller domain-containing protein [Curtobacterium caseinilyticum]MDM7892768.1 LpqB family beta-propeller domain-containing protein [Curtobacterium caseinilyticum]